MIRLALILCLIGGAAMARDKDVRPYDPKEQVVSPDGTVRHRDDPPTKAELADQIWQQYMGDEPMPNGLKRRYGLPAEPPPVRR